LCTTSVLLRNRISRLIHISRSRSAYREKQALRGESRKRYDAARLDLVQQR
jgi:hypothetical protein